MFVSVDVQRLIDYPEQTELQSSLPDWIAVVKAPQKNIKLRRLHNLSIVQKGRGRSVASARSRFPDHGFPSVSCVIALSAVLGRLFGGSDSLRLIGFPELVSVCGVIEFSDEPSSLNPPDPRRFSDCQSREQTFEVF